VGVVVVAIPYYLGQLDETSCVGPARSLGSDPELLSSPCPLRRLLRARQYGNALQQVL